MLLSPLIVTSIWILPYNVTFDQTYRSGENRIWSWEKKDMITRTWTWTWKMVRLNVETLNKSSQILMVMVFIYRIFYIHIHSIYTVYIISVQGWDRISAYTCIGAAGSHYQSICDLTQPHPTMNHKIAQRSNQHTGNSMPYSWRLVCGFFCVPQGYEH